MVAARVCQRPRNQRMRHRRPFACAAGLLVAGVSLHCVVPTFAGLSWLNEAGTRVARTYAVTRFLQNAGNIYKTSGDLQVGDCVQAVYPDDDEWYAATVDKINSDGTFTVRWEDPDGGPVTTDIKPEAIEKDNSVFVDYKVDEVVEAVFPDDGWSYLATVVRNTGHGTFQVRWQDPDGGPECSLVSPKSMKYPPIPLDKLQVGQKHRGTVTSISDFGAFVDIGAESIGLVHISRISKQRFDSIHDILEEGQAVDVWISGFRDDGKFGLTMIEGRLDGGGVGGAGSWRPSDLTAFKSVSPKDWVEGTVRNIAPFGAYVTVTLPSGESADGLLHVSQLSDGYVKDVSTIVEMGQNVKVRITQVEIDRGKMFLSMRTDISGLPPPPRDVAPFKDIPEDQWLTGTIKNVKPFGAFVSVTLPDSKASASGLIHISQIDNGFDELKKGQKVQVRIREVDVTAKRVNFTMKRQR